MPDTPPQPEPKVSQGKMFGHKPWTLVGIGVGAALIVVVGMVIGYMIATNRNDGQQDATGSTTISLTDYHSVDITALPLGDDRYLTSPKQGYVYSCQTSFTGGGASTQGPWIHAAAGVWELTQKAQVDGSVSWTNATWHVSTSDTTRTLTGNSLPINHTTGTYPIAASDDAYQYDRNPNTISSQNISVSLPTNPTLLSTPQCVGAGAIGVMLSGVAIFNAFDAGGRDAVATEVQDSCQGHPQQAGQYHYHGWSQCLEDTSTQGQHSNLVGYVFDGFGIYGLKGEDGVEVSSQDLDVCHGHTHTITWDGVAKEMFHYHMTQDFPYTVSCFQGSSVVQSSAANEGEPGGQPPSGDQSGPPNGGPGGPPGGGQLPPPRR